MKKFICDKCQESFEFVEEMVFLIGDEPVLSEEEGGSGDYDKVICGACFEENN